MTSIKPTYKFGLYSRCPVCKEITQEICEGCGATRSFTDSSKTGIVICTECNLEHSIKCSKASCNNQIKVLRTPKNDDEQKRIDEYIYRKKHKEMDKRVFKVKESPKTTVVTEMKVPIEKIKQKEKEKESIIKIGSESDIDLLDDSKKDEIVSHFREKTGKTEKPAEAPATAEIVTKPEIKPEQEPVIEEKNVQAEETVKPAEPEQAPVKEEPVPIEEKKPAEEKPIDLGEEKKGMSSEELQELDLIKDYWKKKEMESTHEKKEEERRIVNQFYDEQDDDVLDKKINFENIYNETAYFDCRVCGREEQKIICEKCGQTDQFSLNYDALSCKCGNDIKVKTCDCGSKHGHSDFYLISEGIKWQYSKSKSYYNYRKGRMLIFSTCPTCGVFSVEKCKVCGSKVNFGSPNRNNEVYCKNCGSVNQFICENRNCNETVKSLKNPNSIEQKLEWLNEVMNFKSRVTSGRVKYSEPGSEGTKVKASSEPKPEVSFSNQSELDFTNSFIEEFDSKTKEIITSSFIDEVESEVKQRKKLQDELRDYNQTHTGKKSALGNQDSGPSAGGNDVGSEISFDDSGKGIVFYIIIIVVAAVVAAAGWWGYSTFMKGDKTPQQSSVIQEEKAAAAPAEVAKEGPVEPESETVADEEETAGGDKVDAKPEENEKTGEADNTEGSEKENENKE